MEEEEEDEEDEEEEEDDEDKEKEDAKEEKERSPLHCESLAATVALTRRAGRTQTAACSTTSGATSISTKMRWRKRAPARRRGRPVRFFFDPDQ